MSRATLQPGDLLFYTSRGRLYEQVIETATHGPYVHVAVVYDASRLIAAETRGIVYEPYPFGPDAIYTQSHHLTPASEQDAEEALSWLAKRVGAQYGFLDILDQGLRLLRSPVYLYKPNALDCSDLSAYFAALYTRDEKLTQMVMNQRQLIAPNDLARYYGLLK
jgi:hypothetical protein